MKQSVFKNKGIALLMTVGILAILSLIGTAFVMASFLERRQASNYKDSLKATYLAEAGIAAAIACLQQDATSSYLNNPSSAFPFTLTFPEGSCYVSMADEQSKINVNLCPAALLNNLSSTLGAPLDATIGDAIVSNRPACGYLTIQQVMTAGLTKAQFDKLKGYITVTSYSDPNCSNRSPIDVNSAADEVLACVLIGISGPGGTVSPSQAALAVSAIKAARPYTHPDGWSRFDTAIDGCPIPDDIRALIKDNCNPNKVKPSTFTTEFCFFSGGYYTIESTGTATKSGLRTAQKALASVVKIYDIWNQTTKEEFMQPWLDDEKEEIDTEDGDIVWVTWMDSCPIDSSQNWDTGTYDTIANALKLGYWDNFDEYRQYWSADHINDWTSWYWGSGYLFIDSAGRLCPGGGWTLSNLNYNDPYRAPAPRTRNCNRWNTGSRDCTISMNSQYVVGTIFVWKPGYAGYHETNINSYGSWWHLVERIPVNRYRFYFRRRVDSNSDTNICTQLIPLVCNWDGYLSGPSGSNYWAYLNNDDAYQILLEQLKYRLTIQSWMGYEYGEYSFINKEGPTRMTLRLNANNTVAGAYLSNGTIGGVQTIGYSTKSNSGPVVGNYGGVVDNVRVIPGKKSPDTWNGRYISSPKALSSEVKQLLVNGTVTIPSSANKNSETVTFDFWSGSPTDNIQYVAYFSTNNTNLYETPVLEDVVVTYMEPTKICYVR